MPTTPETGEPGGRVGQPGCPDIGLPQTRGMPTTPETGEPGGRVDQQGCPDIGMPQTQGMHTTPEIRSRGDAWVNQSQGTEEMDRLHWILHGPDTRLAGLEGMPALALTTH